MNISIMGDSISTLKGSNPEGYSVFYQGYEAQINNVDSEEKTWWYQTIDSLNGKLCMNNSYSGSRVSGVRFPSSNSERRVQELKNRAAVPDLILVYIGFNDFGYHVPLGKVRLIRRKLTPEFFYDAYLLMIDRMKKAYPESRIVCATLMEPHIKQDRNWYFSKDFPCVFPLEQYNLAIRFACKRRHVYCADLHQRAESNGRITYETLDGVHPTSLGHQTLARAWIQELRSMLH